MKNSSSHYSGEKVISNIDDPILKLKQLEEEKQSVQRGKLFSLLSDNKGNMIISSIAALITGGLFPVQGLILARTINALSSNDDETIRDDGLFYAMMFLILAVVNGVFLFLKIWKFITLGSVITTKMRKLIIDKYLKLHVGYFDIDENSPGALLTKLSLDTTQLNSLVLSVIGDAVSVTGVTIVGLVLGFYYEWRLTLMNLCFIPFIIIARVFVNRTRHGGREGDKKMNIEAGSVLSECVINTKTIYSFNFQKPAVEMYLNILSAATKEFLRDSIIKGILMGFGIFAVYASNATVFHFAYVFIKNGTLQFEDMNQSMNVVMMLSNGIA